jgi:hypothetical protein
MEASKLKPLIDADMLRYEVGYGVQFNESGGTFIHNFEVAQELLHHKIDIIIDETWATEPPTLYLTDDKAHVERQKRRGVAMNYTPNFRDSRATTKPYKGNRVSEKPFHYDNLTEYMLNHFDCKIAKGIEADDLLSIDQNKGDGDTIICSRDKDLRITPGWHYTWPVGKTPSIPNYFVEPMGELQEPVKNKFFGTGLKFFYAQLIMGDPVDNIPGIPRKGPSFAYKLLEDCETEQEMIDRVFDIYLDYEITRWDPDETSEETILSHAQQYFQEQADLLWIIQELDSEGNPVFYNKNDRSQ